MPTTLQKCLTMAWRQLPLSLFVIAFGLFTFAYGGLVGKYHFFPYSVIESGWKTAEALFGADDRGRFLRFSEVSPEDASIRRIDFLQGDSLIDPVLWFGGRFQFAEHCPENGCLAVQLSKTGEVTHAWPYRPKRLGQVANLSKSGALPYELPITFQFARDARPIGMLKYGNDDLLVTFQLREAFPFGGGSARVDEKGYPVWFRADYSHHWPHMSDNDVALIPSLEVSASPITIKNPSGDAPFELDCQTGKLYRDTVNFVDESGNLTRTIDVLGAFLDSPYALLLLSGQDHCDPLHLNYIHEIRTVTGDQSGMSKGDLVLSLRNISAFVILDGQTGRIKRLVRGTFSRQHSVEQLEGSVFLMFDNHGGDEDGGPSRLLEVDLTDGSERTIFPTPEAPAELRSLFSSTAGKIDISPDRRRAMIAFTHEGTVVEVRLADGAVLNVFTSLHDVSNMRVFADERKTNAALFSIYGLDYVRSQ